MITAYAADSAATTATQSLVSSPWVTIIMLVGLLAVFYFLIIRPQKKQERETAEMRSSIAAGDEIVTIGGIIGTVVIVKDDKLMIETGNDRTKLTILKSSVKEVLSSDNENK